MQLPVSPIDYEVKREISRFSLIVISLSYVIAVVLLGLSEKADWVVALLSRSDLLSARLLEYSAQSDTAYFGFSACVFLSPFAIVAYFFEFVRGIGFRKWKPPSSITDRIIIFAFFTLFSLCAYFMILAFPAIDGFGNRYRGAFILNWPFILPFVLVCCYFLAVSLFQACGVLVFFWRKLIGA